MNEERYSESAGLLPARGLRRLQEQMDALDAGFGRLESGLDSLKNAHYRLEKDIRESVDSLWESLPETIAPSEHLESRLEALEKVQEDNSRRLEALKGTLEPLGGKLERTRQDLRALRSQLDLQAEDLRGLDRALDRVQQTRAEPAGGLPEEVEDLRAELRELRRDLDSQVALRLEELLATPGDGDPEDPSDADELLEFAPPSREALSQVEGSLADLARTLPPEPALRMEQELGELRSLLQALDQEEHFRRRAGEILRLLRERLLGRGPQAAFRRRIHDFLFLRVPDLLEDLKEAAHREELTPDALRGFQQALEGLLDKMGLEEFRPREGDLLTVSEHGLLRVERVGKPGLQGRIASCLRPGLRVRATGEIVRKAEVSVFP